MKGIERGGRADRGGEQVARRLRFPRCDQAGVKLNRVVGNRESEDDVKRRTEDSCLFPLMIHLQRIPKLTRGEKRE